MMIRASIKIFRQFKIYNFRFNSNENKDFFISVAKYAIKVKENKIPKDHLQFLRDVDSKKNINDDNNKIDADKSLLMSKFKLEPLINQYQPFEDNEVLTNLNDDHDNCDDKYSTDDYKIPEDLYLSSNEDITDIKETSLDHHLSTEDDESNTSLTIENLKNQIEEIDLDDLKNTPNEIMNIAPLIDKNKTMENLLKLGVDLHKMSANLPGANLLMRLDWDNQVVPTMRFLKQQAKFSDKNLANIFSQFPKIFRKPMLEIENIFYYLKGRKIDGNDLVSIVTKNPLVLRLYEGEIDKQLKDLQTIGNFKAEEINSIIIAKPRVLTEDRLKLKNAIINLIKGVGFTNKEMKNIVLTAPQILFKNRNEVCENFVFLHRSLNISYEDIAQCGSALAFSNSCLRERIKYLISLKRYQLDPTQELYTPLSNIISGDETEFCEQVAHTTVIHFRKFLRTM